jgi:hypothetical protein
MFAGSNGQGKTVRVAELSTGIILKVCRQLDLEFCPLRERAFESDRLDILLPLGGLISLGLSFSAARAS